MGRLVKVKGLFTLLKGFKEVKDKFGDVSLLIAGDGVLRDSLEDFVEKERIKDVHFSGFISPEELPRYYAISDIFVLPSVYEPWGVVVNEAMASGLPVVLSDKVGSKGDLLEEGENGYCFESRNYKELADTMIRMLSNTEKLKAMGERSREIIKGYDYSYCEKNLRKALRTVFSRES
ncbi:MAG: glycosyltransferase family 4 protein, partial [candidate division Zixibacteria bacterium]|nr:glycosyltransferase family 4 protein [candidate division Zixibacteria bacterium]